MIKRRRNGYYQRPSSEDAWVEIERLLIERGWRPSAIASAAGISVAPLQNAIGRWRSTGLRQDFGPVLTAKILRHGEPTKGTIDATPSRRRLRALAVMGWGLAEVSAHSGLGFSGLARLRLDSSVETSIARHMSIARTYRDLSSRPGPSDDTAQRARDKGWVGPMGWANPDILGPDALSVRRRSDQPS